MPRSSSGLARPTLSSPPTLRLPTLVAACALLLTLAVTLAHAQPCVPPPGGLVAWWPLDETGGIAVSDHSGFGNGGTASAPIGSSNGPKSVPGFVGNGLNFYFSNRVSVSSSSPTLTFGTNTSFTIDAWVKGHASPILGNLDLATKRGYQVSLATTPYKLMLEMGNGTSIGAWYGPPLTASAWTFIAVVVDRAGPTPGVTFYTAPPNGNLSPPVFAAIPSTANASSSHTLDIGGCPGNPNGCDTVIDELEIFNRALTQQELLSIVTAGNAGKCSPQKKGMTWIHTASNAQTGTITVGCSNCDATHGDTVCTQQLPLLCIYKPPTPFSLPPGVSNTDHYNLWSGGLVATTLPVAGNMFPHISAPGSTPRSDANSYCQDKFGPGWRVAEFHDGWGWNFQAYGGTVSAPAVPSTRFWVHIKDQPAANCWLTP